MPMLYLRNNLSVEISPQKYAKLSVKIALQGLAALTLCVVLAGCASAPNQLLAPESMKARAMVRAADRWKALTDKRFSDVYEYLSLGSRAGTTPAEYSEAMRRMGYISAEVESAECDPEVCTVRSIVTLPIFIRNVGARPQSIPVVEKWVSSKGDLWLIRN